VRQDAVATLVEDPELRGSLRARLGRIRDLERSATRVSAGRAAPREILGFGLSLGELPHVSELGCGREGRIGELCESLDALDDLRDLVARAISPDAPAALARPSWTSCEACGRGLWNGSLRCRSGNGGERASGP
jgi:DNA mismatch repair protein MutS